MIPPILPRIYQHPAVRATAYTIYRAAPPAIGPYVVVRWQLRGPESSADPDPAFEGDLSGCYEAIPAGLTRCIRRIAADDPAVVETWL